MIMTVALISVLINIGYSQQETQNTEMLNDVALCDAKDQSSAESLLQAVFACQNSRRAKEIIDLVFLGTDVNDQLLGITESDELLVPNMLRDEGITIKDWRAEKLAEFSQMNERALKHVEIIEVSKPSMHDQNPFQYRTKQTFDKALVRYAFTSIDKNAGDEDPSYPRYGRHLVIFLNGKAYLNQLPFDLWELD